MDVSNLIAERAVRNPLFRLLAALLRRIDAWAFDALDARARAQGWQVRRPAPLIRVYRNPDFDTLTRCLACAGEGVTARGHCHACLGSGRVRS
ncbi:hypothetical protein HII36_08880 [Nonomuraea sp. NN258]|uniref:hypothetical protein n=1 Tax=Nonomuraea antri TaxID=2730852 RepID=UPI0015688070|nr:hypothetical protein [Nonomuraea antri]NRQ31953.1 hypothetical protein [Nonomuraea antri]